MKSPTRKRGEKRVGWVAERDFIGNEGWLMIYLKKATAIGEQYPMKVVKVEIRVIPTGRKG